jgi:hypothetical protein
MKLVNIKYMLVILAFFSACKKEKSFFLTPHFMPDNISNESPIEVDRNLTIVDKKQIFNVFLDTMNYYRIKDTTIHSDENHLTFNIEQMSDTYLSDKKYNGEEEWKKKVKYNSGQFSLKNGFDNNYIFSKARLRKDQLVIEIYRNCEGDNTRQGLDGDEFVFTCVGNKFQCKYAKINQSPKAYLQPMQTDTATLVLNHYPARKGDTLIGHFTYLGIMRFQVYKVITDSPFDLIGWFKCVVE